jgi:ribose/xylose/arabinose/galactoside ABC-type transport system permease subunit
MSAGPLDPSTPTSLWRAVARQYRNELGLVAAIVAVVLATMCFSRAYLEFPQRNATEILRQASLLGVFALGAAIVIISGGIDLSSGSMIALGGSICTLTMVVLAPTGEDGRPDTSDVGWSVMAAAFTATIVVGLAVGTLHAWLITVVRLPPFVATLASLVGLRSLAKILNQAVTEQFGNRSTKVNIYDPTFAMLGGRWWIPLVVFLILAALSWLMMSRTVVGRRLYAMGGNEEAARLSGVRTDRLKWLAYCIGSTTAAIAGILYASEVGSADPQSQGSGYELNAIAAAVVGGCSLQGGVGLIPGVMLGVLFLRVAVDAVAKVIQSGSDDYEGLIVGFLVVLAVAFNESRRHAGGARKQFFPGILGALTIVILTALFTAIAAIMGGSNVAAISGIATLVVLIAVAAVGKRGMRHG